ncbi:tetraspanin-31-B-like [Petromyzon marinus]|uniref:Tetraspanin 31 n=1 Tax=Petromyzon marinus TaxID=7757 RepID=S4RXT3_PETMA|nr:tetraspanin-31-B-like [Petromyzon marinus]
MMCGGFTCSKNALCALNVIYIIVGLLLMAIAGWGLGYGVVNTISLIGGVVAVAIFLFLIAIVGLVGAMKHHQVLLFFYIVILFLLFIVQFSVSCSCLAFNSSQQETLLKYGWKRLSNRTVVDLEKKLDCCGFFQQRLPVCLAACQEKQHCSNCGTLMLNHAKEALQICGGVGLFFSFTEIVGVWLAARFRNQKDPRANPSAFL